MADEDNQWCFAWPVARVGGEGKDRAALVKDSKWNAGDVITVSFLDGDPSVQKKVAEVAKTWTAAAGGPARLTLDFRKNTKTKTLIRISFQNPGSWSVIGTTCKLVTDPLEPTMNFGWLTPDSTDAQIHRVVLHEFGHAFCVIYEDEIRGSVIKWNKPNVYGDLQKPPNSWSKEDIDHNMFEPYAKAETNFTKVDPLSIMMYPIPKRWTLDGFHAELNAALSATDKKFMHQQYP